MDATHGVLRIVQTPLNVPSIISELRLQPVSRSEHCASDGLQGSLRFCIAHTKSKNNRVSSCFNLVLRPCALAWTPLVQPVGLLMPSTAAAQA
jgi:hypothetical protein